MTDTFLREPPDKKRGNCHPALTSEQIFRRSHELSARWRQLCDRFLPVIDENSSWRYSRSVTPDNAEQGWKLHLSATILSAGQVLERVAPFLISRNVLFKAPKSLQHLLKLNSGVSHGYSQIGKFITVYPPDTTTAVELAECLHRLTIGMPAPAVPFDRRYRPGSGVFYRYGAFRYQETENSEGAPVPAIRDLSGKLVPDLREQAKPPWLEDPFRTASRVEQKHQGDFETPLRSTYHIFRALRQRGKGGVYQAVNTGTHSPSLAVVKEGRRFGEVGWDGSDGFRLVKYEAGVLHKMQATGINAPRLLAAFEIEQNFYLVTEFIEGHSLDELLKRRRRRLSIKHVVKYAEQLAELLVNMHGAGWVWRDCKPGNLIAAKDGSLRPLDFESAGRINQIGPPDWRTAEFSVPEIKEPVSRPVTAAEDIYSFGAVLYFLITGKFHQPEEPLSIKKLRRGVPFPLQQIVEETLVLPIRKKRPSAELLRRKLLCLLNSAEFKK